jgi:hypothetical protein
MRGTMEPSKGLLTAVTFILVGLSACASTGSSGNGDPGAPDAASSNPPDAASGGGDQSGCQGLANCYSVYAHGDRTLYVVDLQAKTLRTVGSFNADETITDLAVAPDNTIYVISETAIYTADPNDAHVTKVGSLAACGRQTVALTTLPSGKIYAGDYMGALCELDVSTTPPTVKPPVMMRGGLALTGDMVALGDGTVYGTAYRLSDNGSGSQNSNLLVTIDVTTGDVTPIGSGSGYPKLFGTSFALDKVFGFTHDGSGNVVTIDPSTGQGTIYATFTDPATNHGIAFAGAGVNSLITIH